MRPWIVLLFFILVTGSCDSAKAQRQLFTTYSMNEGLAHNGVRDIFQDSRGFIWIGTWEGLSMYDGNKFTNYTTANGLSHAVVNDIFEPKAGNIYIACNDGSLDLIKNNGTPERIHRNTVINRLQPVAGKIIASTDENGLYEFNDGKLSKPRQDFPGRNYYHVAAFNDSLIIALGDSAVQLLNHRYELFCEWKDARRIFSESALLIDSKKRVWVGTAFGLKLLSPDQEKGKPIRLLELPATFDIPTLKEQWIRDMLEDNAGNIWIGTPNGLVKIGADGSQKVMTEKDGLPTNDVSCVFQDREKNIWVGGSRGVARLITKTDIRIYTVESGLLSNNISHVLPLTNGNIIAVSGKELQLYEQDKGSFTSLPSNKNYFTGIDQNSSLSIMQEKKIGFSFLIFSRKKDDPFLSSPSSYGGYFALKDQKEGFFYPSNSGLQFSHNFLSWQKALFYDDNKALLIDSKGDMWVGSLDSGLYRIRYDYINDTPRVVQQDHYFPAKGIRSIYEDSKGYIWAGSRYDGVFRLDPNNPGSGILHFDQSTGLTSNRVTSIGEGKKGCIWIDFYTGLDKLIPSGNTYRVFNFSRFNNLFTNIQSMVFDKDHSLWLGTTQGLVNIADGELENTKALDTYIMSASLGDSVYRNYNNDKRITLSYRHKQVQFEFTAPGFINEKQLQFSYRLLGSNNTDWSEPSNEHSVSYANLQPGTYRFEVRNKGWNDEWGEPAYFLFNIRPPFWQTAWFIVLVALLAAAIIYWLVKRRIKAIRKQSILKQKITETEMMALRAQMNPHFIFNCLNAIDNLIQTNQKDKATVYLSRFAKLVRNVLDSSKNNVVPFHKDYESLQLYLQMEQFRCNNKFEYELNVDDELLHGDYRVPPLIIQPFVENAIHHGLLNKETNDRKLIVSAGIDRDYIRYTISDNGIGRTKAGQLKQINKPEYQSYGIQITEERIHLYNHENKSSDDVTITDLYKDKEPSGTSVVIRLRIADDK